MKYDDLISRDKAIKKIESMMDADAKGEIGGFYNTILKNVINLIKTLPSVKDSKDEQA